MPQRGRLLDLPLAARLAPVRAEDVVERQIAAFNARDLEAFIATYASDATVTGVAGAVEGLRGHEALRRHFGARLAQPGIRVMIEERVALGRWIVDRETVTNEIGSAEAIVVYEVEEGLIRCVNVIYARPR